MCLGAGDACVVVACTVFYKTMMMVKLPKNLKLPIFETNGKNKTYLNIKIHILIDCCIYFIKDDY